MEIPVTRDATKIGSKPISVNFNSFLSSAKEEIKMTVDNAPIAQEDTKRRRVKNSNIVKKENEDLPIVQTNIPYEKTYEDNNNALRATVNQIDELTIAIRQDIEDVRKAKAFKGKYNVLPNLANTMASLISSKVTAIRTMNDTITQSNNMDFKRHKELSIAANAVNDDKAIMDTYNAFISMAGGNNNVLGYTDAMISSPMINPNKQIHYVNGGNPTENIGMSPEFSRVYGNMKYESDPNIQTVVVYNQSTGAMYFDVMNVSTGDIIQGVERPDPMFLDDISIDIPNRTARNTNINQTYNLILVGDPIGAY